MERIEQLKKFLEANATDSFLKHALALEHVKLGDDETAKQLFEELLEAEPGYVGSYYHLGKLFERIGDNDKAIEWYQKGMEVAKAKGEQHALGELRGAFEELTF
ncbi:tetratricopeptide repeat protein [Lacibacter sp.]|uniref:tetratricopeptide repeat protein n=1 Tax=Lacibacter sp. TaxID=1915409 RepID=UPI002B4ACAA3|nr:tetratricopeptide repeat protein [Lacibacter sp.]HLP37787.1 tetratricopeptide repeat protein [Lacibacter sp.]